MAPLRLPKEHSLAAMARMLFNCQQVELRGAAQMAPGRYVLRPAADAEIEHVLVVQELPGARTRLTLIDAPPLAEQAQGEARLEALDHAAELAHLEALLARVYAAARIANDDPGLHAPPEWARIEAARAGFGAGEELAHGRLERAREIRLPDHSSPPTRRARLVRGRRRRHAPAPQERFAAILSGRARPLLCEELALRARADLDFGRIALGAIGLDRAYSAALLELAPRAARQPQLRAGERIAELEALHAEVAQAAAAALAPARGSAERPAPIDEQLLRHALQRLEAALQARALGLIAARSPA